ncbi:hypothetical protein [Actinoallomurus sp. CA-142502]|uniref:hypothetical protein n=1 Tax=Actinoallomurus sp. CA-142502 TaxID=3239885 RepID=UPI003D8A3594
MNDHPTTRPPEASTRKQQLAAAQALVKLLKVEDMPELTWEMSAYDVRLEGLVRSNQSDEERRDDVAFWADLLEVDVAEDSGTYEDGVAWHDVFADGTFNDFRVKVWTRFHSRKASA